MAINLRELSAYLDVLQPVSGLTTSSWILSSGYWIEYVHWAHIVDPTRTSSRWRWSDAGDSGVLSGPTPGVGTITCNPETGLVSLYRDGDLLASFEGGAVGGLSGGAMQFDISTGGQAGIDWTNLITVQRIPKEWPWVDVAELKDWAGDILRVIVEDGWLKSNISSGSIHIHLDWKVAHLFERVVVYDRFRLPPPPTFIPSVSSFEAPALMRHRAYATTETAISRRADNPWFTSHTKATAVAVEAASSVNAMQMPGQAARLIYIADAQVMQALSTDGEETFSVAATGLTGYKHVEALELPFDARMLLLLYRESDGQWLQSLGRFDAAASQYVEWVPPVATGLFGADARGSLKRLADGQVAFSYIDSENEVQVVRCTAVKYDATGTWT